MEVLQTASDSACEQVFGGNTELNNEASTGRDKTLTWEKSQFAIFQRLKNHFLIFTEEKEYYKLKHFPPHQGSSFPREWQQPCAVGCYKFSITNSKGFSSST